MANTVRQDLEDKLALNLTLDIAHSTAAINGFRAAIAAGQAMLGGGTSGAAAPFAQSLSINPGIDSSGETGFFQVTINHATGVRTVGFLSDAAAAVGSWIPTGVVEPITGAQEKAFNQLEADSEIINLSDAAISTLTVPATAVGAVIQLEISSGDGCGRIYANGIAPTQVDGEKVFHGNQISLGRTPIANGDPMELGNFQAIMEASTAGILRVTYYEEA